MHNLTSNPARLAAAAIAALIALILGLYLPSILHTINPCLNPNNCLSPYQLDVLFQKVTNATNGNIANTLRVVQEIQAEVPACPGGAPSYEHKDEPWLNLESFVRSIDCSKCWCRGGKGLSALTCVPCCESGDGS
jgi:hypothetical protein